MNLLILSHGPTRVLEEGFIPAAVSLQLKITILTDCATEHAARAKASPLYGQCELAGCDVCNPLAVVRLVSVYGREFSGVLAADAALRASAAAIADYLELPGPSLRSAVLSDQRLELRRRFEPEASRRYGGIINCVEPDTKLGSDWFPASVQSLETYATSGGAIVLNAEELKRRLAGLRYGYALVERHYENEDVYSLEALGTPDGLAVLCGTHIEFADDDNRTKRVQAVMPRPPRCDELLALLRGFDLGLGRHHIEYAVADDGIRIREIHNGLHNDESEFALNDRLDGDLFSETIKLSIGKPVKPLRLICTGTRPVAILDVTV